MKNTLLLLLVCFCLSGLRTFGQENLLSQPKWSFRLTYAGQVANQHRPLFYWRVCDEGCYPVSQQSAFTNTIRLKVSRQIGRNVSIGLGIAYMPKTLWEEGLSNNGDSRSYSPYRDKLVLHTVGIPVTAQYDFLKLKRITLFVESGLVLVLPIEQKSSFQNRFKSQTYDALVVLGGRFSIKNQFQLVVSPSFTTALSPYNRPHTFTGSQDYLPYSLGVDAGFQVNF